jgi:hypothetical protein
MKIKYFNILLQVSAFLLPVYFIFYPPLNENPKDPFIKSLGWFIAAGFCFYGILALIIFVI